MMKNKICRFGLIFGIFFLGAFLLISQTMSAKLESEPAIPFTDYFDHDLIDSIVFQEATLSDFCEVNSETKECISEFVEVISGYAVLKYTPKLLEILPDYKKEEALNNEEQYLDYIQSQPFVFFIINNQLFIGGIAGGYAPSPNKEAILRFSSGQSGILKDLGATPSKSWEYSSQVLLNGLSLQSVLMFDESATIDTYNNQIQNYEPFDMFYIMDFDLSYPQKEPIPSGTGETQIIYDVGGVTGYQEYQIVEVKNSITNLEVEK